LFFGHLRGHVHEYLVSHPCAFAARWSKTLLKTRKLNGCWDASVDRQLFEIRKMEKIPITRVNQPVSIGFRRIARETLSQSQKINISNCGRQQAAV
jgi:hypothetical protein